MCEVFVYWGVIGSSLCLGFSIGWLMAAWS